MDCKIQRGYKKKKKRRMKNKHPLKFVTHSYRVSFLAERFGWMPGARYTNLRDVRKFERVGFLDIDWKNYDFKRHLEATKAWRPFITVAKDLESRDEINRVLDEAWELSLYCEHVVVVPKDIDLAGELDTIVPDSFLLGYSVPTKYGQTPIHPSAFKRPVHLLGGRPDVQRRLGDVM